MSACQEKKNTNYTALSLKSTSDAVTSRPWTSAFVGAWAVKLAAFLFYRALGHRDGRLEGTTKTLSGCVGFWFVSFVWGWLTLLPHALGGRHI